MCAHFVEQVDSIFAVLEDGDIPVIVEHSKTVISQFNPIVVVDARMEKRNIDTRIDDAPLVIGLGPGFVAGNNCHAVIETNRGHSLGRVLYAGAAEADTGEPGKIAGQTHSRVLRAPRDGHVIGHKQIGEYVQAGEVIAMIGKQAVIAPI